MSGTSVGVNSGVNPDGKPFCQVTLDGEPLGQLSPAEVRRMGLQFIEAASAAENDAIIFAWLRDKIEMPIEPIAVALTHVRQQRRIMEEHNTGHLLDGQRRQDSTDG